MLLLQKEWGIGLSTVFFDFMLPFGRVMSISFVP